MRFTTVQEAGSLIRKQRKANGITQQQLADQLGVSRLWVNKIESGRHPRAEANLLLSALQAVGYTLDAQPPIANQGPERKA
jgi:transcriptional regulator with XRE-family HTH domain